MCVKLGSSCVVRVNLAKGSMALQEFITLDPVALASFCESSTLMLFLSDTRGLFGSRPGFVLGLLSSVFLSAGPLSEPADDQRQNPPVPGLQRNIMVGELVGIDA